MIQCYKTLGKEKEETIKTVLKIIKNSIRKKQRLNDYPICCREFANEIARPYFDEHREKFLEFLCPLLKGNNWRFDEQRFREWIKRVRNGESTKGLG